MKIPSLIFLLFCSIIAKSNTISVVTYNVNYHFVNKDIGSILDSINGDVVCLQETNPEWEKIIKNDLSKTYSFIDFTHSGRAGGYAVLSKYPIISNRPIPNKIGWFQAKAVTIVKDNDTIQVLNTHLKPKLTRKGWIGWNAYFKAEDIHINELEGLMKALDLNLPTVILGDLNEGDKGKALVWLKKKGYQDALPQFNKRAKTWRFIILRGRFDHLIHNNKLKCTDSQVYKLGKSDHFPVAGTFEWK